MIDRGLNEKLISFSCFLSSSVKLQFKFSSVLDLPLLFCLVIVKWHVYKHVPEKKKTRPFSRLTRVERPTSRFGVTPLAFVFMIVSYLARENFRLAFQSQLAVM